MDLFILLGVLGLGSAAAYTLLSAGLVLIYRASGVLNFAQGALAMIGAFLFFELQVTYGWAFAPAVVVTVLVMSGFGAMVYFVLLRPLRHASVVVRVIATLGLLLVLQAFATLRYGGVIQTLPTTLPNQPIDLFGVSFPRDRLYLMGIAVVVMALLHLLSTRTRFGIVTRAVAENERAAAAYGWSPTSVAAINWAIGSGLAALAGVLLSPIAQLSVPTLTLLVVPAMAVALFGRFSSFPLTLLGAVIVGVGQGVLTKYQADLPGLPSLVPLVLIVVVLVVRRGALPERGEILQRLPSLGAGSTPLALPAALLVVGVVASLALPVEWAVALGVSVVAGIVLLSIVVLTGYAGQLSLGQYSLAGVGALVAAELVVGRGWPFLPAIIAGVLGAGAFGAVFGLTSLRSRGAALAIVTLGLGAALSAVIFGNAKFAGGPTGFQVDNLQFFGISLDPIAYPRRYTIFCLVWFALAVLVVSNLRRSEAGRRLISIRTNERAAASLGINVKAAKLYAFAISAALAGLGGILLAFGSTTILLSQGFDPVASMAAVSLAVVGGVGFVSGPAMGGQLAAGGLPGGVIANHTGGGNGAVWLSLIGGVLLLVMLRFNPNGLVGTKGAEILRNRRRQRARGQRELGDGKSVIDPLPATQMLIAGLSVSFGGVKALQDVDLALNSGQVVGLIGPNGAGKTTLIDAITGYVGSSGSVTVGEHRVDGTPPHARSRAGISRCFQSLELFDDISVEENLRTASDDRGLWAYVRGPLFARKRPLTPAVRVAVEEFELWDDLQKTPQELSYGKRKLVAIARSVATSPAFLLLDEPAAGLDERESRELGSLIRRLADEWNMGVLLIEHDVNLVMTVSDRVAVLEFGTKIADGLPTEVQADARVIAAYLGHPDDPEVAAADELVTAGPGTGARPEVPTLVGAGTPVARAENLSTGYAAGPVLQGIDLTVHAGQVVALLGPNGAGKTTTVLSLAGVLSPMSGSVSFASGSPGAGLHRRARTGLGYLAEERSVFMAMTVAENLRVAGVSTGDAYEYFPELERLARRRTGLLSGGEQQMLALAAVLARRPSLLLADELSLGLAPLVVDRLLSAVRSAADAGAGVLLVEQHVSKALQYADYVYVLRRGRIVLEGEAADLRGRPEDLEAAYMSADQSSPGLVVAGAHE